MARRDASETRQRSGRPFARSGILVEAELPQPTARELAALAGRHRSDEVGNEWTLSIADAMLVATGPAFDGRPRS